MQAFIYVFVWVLSLNEHHLVHLNIKMLLSKGLFLTFYTKYMQSLKCFGLSFYYYSILVKSIIILVTVNLQKSSFQNKAASI